MRTAPSSRTRTTGQEPAAERTRCGALDALVRTDDVLHSRGECRTSCVECSHAFSEAGSTRFRSARWSAKITSMSASVWIGAVAGIIGTATGGALTIWSGRWTHRAQERTARAEQQRARAAAAAEAALAELLEIHRDFRKARTSDGDEWRQRLRLLHDRIAKVQVLLHSIPDIKLRTRVREDTFYMPLSPPDDRRTGSERRVAIIELCADAIACLGAFLRDEELPARSARVEDTRNLWPEWKHKDDSHFYMWEADDGDLFD